jgi:hypothetical protein
VLQEERNEAKEGEADQSSDEFYRFIEVVIDVLLA